MRSLSFGHFSDAMRQRADQIVVVSRFKFTRDETLNTTLNAPINGSASGSTDGKP